MSSAYNSWAALALFLVVAPHPANSCPLFFTVLNSYSSALRAACSEGNLTTCCQATRAGMELGLAEYLEESGFFLLHNVTQARLCLRRLRAQMQVIGVQEDVVNDCGIERINTTDTRDRVSELQWLPELCHGIQSVQDFRAVAAPLGPLDLSCGANLADLDKCQLCRNDMRSVQDRLSNGTMSVECFNFLRMYVIQAGEPRDEEAVFCVYGLRSNPSSSESQKIWYAIGFVVAVAVIGIIVGVALWVRWRRGENAVHREFLLRNNRMLAYHSSLVFYDWAELKTATDGFSAERLVGEGGYGCVYKGVLKDGRVVAVKKFKNCTPEGDFDFLNEVEVLSQFRHRNLVNLQGFCIASSKRSGHQRLLVYDYMPNLSLADYTPVLRWEQRRHIAIGIAQGLAYLHGDAKPQVIHRDIKASNILLDAQLNAHIADFGLAKFKAEDDSFSSHCHIQGTYGYVRCHIQGTVGYVAPEYALYGQLSEKSDVYSFGVCLLELLSGRPALAQSQEMERQSTDSRDSQMGSSYLVTDWAWSLIVDKRPLEIVDASIRDASSQIQAVMTRFVMVGMLCAHVMVSMRPSMIEALRMLEGHRAVPVDRVFVRQALPLSPEAGDYVSRLAGRYNAMEVDMIASTCDGPGSGPMTTIPRNSESPVGAVLTVENSIPQPPRCKRTRTLQFGIV